MAFNISKYCEARRIASHKIDLARAAAAGMLEGMLAGESLAERHIARATEIIAEINAATEAYDAIDLEEFQEPEAA